MALVVIVTGLSGSGKTTALHALEDLGFFCMDNLPVVLLPKVLELAGGQQPFDRVAVVVDAREQQFLPDAGGVIDELRGNGVRLDVLFLDADDDELLERFRSTRRRHPVDLHGDVRDAVRRERGLLQQLRGRATHVIDSSGLSVHELKALVQSTFEESGRRPMSLKIISFGFKKGIPTECDLVFDVRFLRNPNFVAELREGTGLDADVAAYVELQEDAVTWIEKVEDLLAFLLPRYSAEGKVYLTIGVGCTGGRHRSVALAERLGKDLAALGHKLLVVHRERSSWHPRPEPPP